MKLVDAHHHLWDPTRRTYDWLAGLDPIRRPYTEADLRAVTPASATVLVQTVGETDETVEFLGVAASSSLVAGVVGWVDLTAPGIADQLASLRSARGGAALVGIRHQAQDEPDPRWLVRPEVIRGITAVRRPGSRTTSW